MVESSTSIDSINYIVIGRTGKIFTKTSDVNSIAFEIKFVALAWMVPEATVLIFYTHHTGELIYDQVTVKIESNLLNIVSSITKRVYHFFFLYHSVFNFHS